MADVPYDAGLILGVSVLLSVTRSAQKRSPLLRSVAIPSPSVTDGRAPRLHALDQAGLTLKRELQATAEKQMAVQSLAITKRPNFNESGSAPGTSTTRDVEGLHRAPRAS